MKSSLWLLPIGAAALSLAAYTHHCVALAQVSVRQTPGDLAALQWQLYWSYPQAYLGHPAPPVPVHVEYTITDLGTLGGNNSRVAGLNARGEVVGTSEIAASGDTNGYAHAFLYSGGKMRDLDAFNGNHSEALAINDTGEVVGKASYVREGRYSTHFFIYSNANAQILDALDRVEAVTAINNAGQILAYYDDAEKGAAHTFIYSGGSLHELDALVGKSEYPEAMNSTGEMAGTFSTKEDYRHAFVYSGGKVRDLGTLGGWESYAEAINGKGQIAGGADPAGSNKDEFWYFTSGADVMKSESMRLHAFIYSGGKMRDLGPLDGSPEAAYQAKTYNVGVLGGIPDTAHEFYSKAYGINASGQAVGTFGGYKGLFPRAFLYSGGKMIDLNTRVDMAHSGFAVLNTARAINDTGQIAGEGAVIGAGTHAFLLTPIYKK